MIVVANQLRCQYNNRCVLDGIDLQIKPKAIAMIVGGSGCGKSTLLRHLMLLSVPASGTLALFDTLIDFNDETLLQQCRRRMGVLFQNGALFSSLTVRENVEFVLKEFTGFSQAICRELAELKIYLTGLPLHAADLYPSELSGGMQKRAALARALALDPQLLLLDEPTSGLDPTSSRTFDDLILELRDSLGLTVVMITHDMASLTKADQVIYLSQGKVLFSGSFAALLQSQEAEIAEWTNVNAHQRVAAGLPTRPVGSPTSHLQGVQDGY